MKTLALKGPKTRYELANRISGKAKEGETRFAYSTIHKRIKHLLEMGYIVEKGTTKKFKYPGRPKKVSLSRKERKIKKNTPHEKTREVKHETTLYGLSFAGLSFIFMEDPEVRKKWEEVEDHYEEAKLNVWLKFARDWVNNEKLNIFPLKHQYAEDAPRHYKPNPQLFVQSVIFSKAKSREDIEKGLDEVVKLLRKYHNRNIAKRIRWALQKESELYKTRLERCKLFQKKLNALKI